MEEIFNYILLALSGSLSVGALVAVSRHCHGLLVIFRSCANCFCQDTHIPSHLDTLPVYYTRAQRGEAINSGVSVIGQHIAPVLAKATSPNLPSTAVCEK